MAFGKVRWFSPERHSRDKVSQADINGVQRWGQQNFSDLYQMRMDPGSLHTPGPLELSLAELVMFLVVVFTSPGFLWDSAAERENPVEN